MVARQSLLIFCLALLLTGCAVFRGESVQKIALLSSFEGAYREIGYDALYAARLAISESGLQNIDLLAIDDGGSVESVITRANAIRQDSAIQAVIALGIYATDSSVQAALGDIPMLIVGHWGAAPSQPNVFMLSSPEIPNQLNWQGKLNEIPATGEIRGSELLALYQLPLVLEETSRLTIYSSSSLPNEDFRQRFLNSALYVPEPNLLATLSYDAASLVLESLRQNSPISAMTYEGINGRIAFENGYWLNAPIHRYGYDAAGQLIPKP